MSKSRGTMNLRVKDAAGLLHVSEKTIYRWIAQEKLPVHRVSGQYRFNRAELLEWATGKQIPLSPRILEEQEEGPIPQLEEALRSGGVHYRVGGTDKATVLQSVVDVLPLPEGVDRAFLIQVLLARESLGSTGIGNGIAIPHVRNPITLHVTRPLVALCYLEHPIDFEAIDGKPVHTLFTIISPTARAHLNLLSKLSFGLRSSELAQIVAQVGSREEIFEAAARLDSRIAAMNPPREVSNP
jgi:nitrogen PTS system EIIA component